MSRRAGTPPLANVITLGVHDLEAETRFYRELGWPQVVDLSDFAAFELRGAVLALFPIDRLAVDARSEPSPPHPGIGFSLGIMADSPAQVDELVERADRAGARVTKPARDAEAFSGRSAYFADPEGNYWEVAWAAPDNPIVAAARRAAAEVHEPVRQ